MLLALLIIAVYVAVGLVFARIGATWKMRDIEGERERTRYDRYNHRVEKPGDPWNEVERFEINTWAAVLGFLWPFWIIAIPAVYVWKKVIGWVLPKNVFNTAEMKQRNEQDIERLENLLARAKAKARQEAAMLRDEAKKLGLAWPEDEKEVK